MGCCPEFKNQKSTLKIPALNIRESFNPWQFRDQTRFFIETKPLKQIPGANLNKNI
jgi:hypothetical protein